MANNFRAFAWLCSVCAVAQAVAIGARIVAVDVLPDTNHPQAIHAGMAASPKR